MKLSLLIPAAFAAVAIAAPHNSNGANLAARDAGDVASERCWQCYRAWWKCHDTCPVWLPETPCILRCYCFADEGCNKWCQKYGFNVCHQLEEEEMSMKTVLSPPAPPQGEPPQPEIPEYHVGEVEGEDESA